MIPVSIDLIECNLVCHSRECWNFFKNQNGDRFVVKFKLGHINKCEYSLLEKNFDSAGNLVIILNSNFLYNYGENCKILGYCPIGINDQKKL